MDSLDMQILQNIEKEGRISHEELSKRLNLSRPAIHNRVTKLEEHGVISGYRTKIDWVKLGYTTNALISLRVRTTNYDKLLEQLKTLEINNLVIEECHIVTGTWCIIMKIRCKTPIELKALQDQLHTIDSIKESSTSLILSSLYD
ncbi:Lrp/AsnC family transcriptional regulator [Sedimentibacter hydroxybenzoicus DSM 7310]|uniref:Lrp/AsnC family transcriptional regulator n=1 Tax=Sedimentibacter hydroxybenzoicus DSM 7310 TaxID=1123245 RepID=A0A974GV48_SEDHY|nr:Lrp/AsnC family transcriptional regulator [Sedimentibacter hydroxybenzoicus]NYB72997.1 Lrp/AsnC family transcriptional regulator [Sedimentibacter hydroxybenzoicus DSM 7310]